MLNHTRKGKDFLLYTTGVQNEKVKNVYTP